MSDMFVKARIWSVYLCSSPLFAKINFDGSRCGNWGTIA